MTIFTRRGGQIVFAGFLAIAISIGLAGYKAMDIITSTFLGDLFAGDSGAFEPSFFYPSGTPSGASLGPSIAGFFIEVIVRSILNTLITVSDELILYFLVLGSLLIFSVVVAFPFFAAGADPKSVQIQRRLGKVKGFAGDYVLVEVRVKNTSLNRISAIEIYDAYPEVFELVLGENFITAQLTSKKAITFAYIVQIPVRGKFYIGPTKVIVHDSQGFFSNEAVLADLTEILVYPSYEDIKKLQMMGDKRKLGNLFGAHKTKIKGSGTDFFGIRQFQPGDPLKNVHWPSVAKTGDIEKLMVREFESEQNIRVVIMLDASASMGAGLPRNTKLEYSIRSAVMMAYLALEKKDTVGLCIYDDEVRQFLEPSGSQAFMFQFLETLANVTPNGQGNLGTAVDYLLPRLNKASYIVLLTDMERPRDEIIGAIQKLRAHKHRIFIISPFGPSFETRISELDQFDRLVGMAIQESLIADRSELIKLLRGTGTTALSVGPDDMLANVMSEFSKLKASS